MYGMEVIPECHSSTRPIHLVEKTAAAAATRVRGSNLSVDEMTSREFTLDVNALYDVAKDRLLDKASISIFQEAILTNRHIFGGRIVLDVSCGLGILSLFAAKAGAKRVYAVDPSKVTDYTRRIVAANGFADVIHVINSSVQKVELPHKVDIIIGNWVGYSLLFQSVCDAVIFARDKWLKKGGVILPDIAKLFVAAMEDKRCKSERIDWWNNVYGFGMNCIRQFAFSEPIFKKLSPGQVISTEFCVKTLDMNTATYEDLKIRSMFILEMHQGGFFDGVVTYFTVFFSKTHKPLQISTEPRSACTQWLQSVFFFDKEVWTRSGQIFYGGLEMKSATHKGKLDLNKMEVAVELFSGEPKELQMEAQMRWLLNPRIALPDDDNDDCSKKPAKYKELKKDKNQNDVKATTFAPS